MTPADLNPRLAVQVRLALSPADEAALLEASRAGLTGAEIDAACQGRSFDVQAEAAIVLALTVRAGGACDAARRRVRHVGLCDRATSAITILARESGSS